MVPTPPDNQMEQILNLHSEEFLQVCGHETVNQLQWLLTATRSWLIHIYEGESNYF